MKKRTACVVGWPIAHSRSPMIHRHWLNEFGIDGDYVSLPVEPRHIDRFFSDFPASGYVGGNVTVPYKETAFRRVAEADEAAAALGAVNTLWLDDGRLIGGNTDAYGFLANLDTVAPGWDRGGATAILLGAGGAARAVAWSLAQRGFSPVVVVNRTPGRADELAARLGGEIRTAGWGDLPEWLPRARLLVNATTLGMRDQPPLDIDLSPLPADAVVNDLVYAPLETGLLTAARRRGLTAVTGLGMLLHQAVPGFEKWFGKRPAVTPALYDLIAADLVAGG